MIKKEIIEKIIYENNETKPKSKILDMENISIEKLKWADNRIDLRDFISKLSKDDIIDLIVLMDYGRDIYHMKTGYATQKDFIQRRHNFRMQMSTDKEKQEKASYLLKNAYLSEYLQCTLRIFEDKDLNF